MSKENTISDDYVNRISFYTSQIHTNQNSLSMLELETNVTNPDYRFKFVRPNHEDVELASTVKLREVFIDMYHEVIEDYKDKLNRTIKEIAENTHAS